MDEETKLAIAEVLGKANAALCLQIALMSKILSADDAAIAFGVADQTLAMISEGQPEALEFGKSALRGFASVFNRSLTKN
jgi:hypothetical protein